MIALTEKLLLQHLIQMSFYIESSDENIRYKLYSVDHLFGNKHVLGDCDRGKQNNETDLSRIAVFHQYSIRSYL